jgi:hypothetical protein
MQVLEEWNNWIATNPWVVNTVALATVVGLVLAIVLYFRAKRHRAPCYAIHTENLVAGVASRIPEVEIHFQGYGESVGTLSASKLVFWNNGRETIRKQDVVKAAPVMVRMQGDCKILDVSILSMSEPTNQFTITRSQDRSSATLTFEYVDHGEGVLVQILHTGLSDDAVQLDGRVMGAGEPRRISSIQDRRYQRRNAVISLFVGVGVTLAASVVFEFLKRRQVEAQPFFPLLLLGGLLTGYYSRSIVDLILRPRVPRAFREFARNG